jgi:hypothetical protein
MSSRLKAQLAPASSLVRRNIIQPIEFPIFLLQSVNTFLDELAGITAKRRQIMAQASVS